MLERYRGAVDKIDRRVKSWVAGYMDLDEDATSFFSALEQRGVGQADLVIALLRCPEPGAMDAVAAVVGKPVEVLPPDPYLKSYMFPLRAEVRPTEADERRARIARRREQKRLAQARHRSKRA